MLYIHLTLVWDIITYQFYLDMDSDLKQCVARLSVNRLDLAQQVIFDNILSILNVELV